MNLLATAGGMVLPSTQQQLLSAVAFGNSAQFLQNSSTLLNHAFTTTNSMFYMHIYHSYD